MLARTGKDPSELFNDLTLELGNSFYERIDVPASADLKNRLKAISAECRNRSSSAPMK